MHAQEFTTNDHLPRELAELAGQVERGRAVLSDAAMQRIVAGTLPVLMQADAASVEQGLPSVIVLDQARASRRAAVSSAMRPAMRLAAAIAICGSVGAAVVAQRSAGVLSTATPMQSALARATLPSGLPAGLQTGGQTGGQRLAGTMRTGEPQDDVAMWESWLAAADVTSVSERAALASNTGRSDDSSVNEWAANPDDEAESGVGGDDELDWLDLGLDGLTDPMRDVSRDVGMHISAQDVEAR